MSGIDADKKLLNRLEIVSIWENQLVQENSGIYLLDNVSDI